MLIIINIQNGNKMQYIVQKKYLKIKLDLGDGEMEGWITHPNTKLCQILAIIVISRI